jgi:ceramide glucosyltransferase
VIGKSMLLRRSELRALGGIELVRDILCEDFVLGQAYQGAGKRVILSSIPVENINEHTSVYQFLSRHGRWMKMRVVIDVRSYVADLFTNPVGLCLLAVLTGGFVTEHVLALAATIPLKLAGDAYLVRRTRGRPMAFHNLLLAPIKDVLMIGVFVHSAFSRSVEWRGVRLRFGAQSRLRQDDGSLPVRVARRLTSRL